MCAFDLTKPQQGAFVACQWPFRSHCALCVGEEVQVGHDKALLQQPARGRVLFGYLRVHLIQSATAATVQSLPVHLARSGPGRDRFEIPF